MGYQMKLDEIQEALSNASHPLAGHFERILCATGDAMAAALSEALGIEHGSAEQHGIGFAGICCPFYPAYKRQPLPEALEGFDDAEAWENTREDLPPKPKAARSRSAQSAPRSPAQTARRRSFGDRSTCSRCALEIEFHGKRTWLDRGGNSRCAKPTPPGEFPAFGAKHQPNGESEA